MAKFSIKFTRSALRQLHSYRKSEQKLIVENVRKQLSDTPLEITRNRKSIRENPLSRWELRVRKYRVFYNVDEIESIVEIKAVGHKVHNKLYIDGKEYEL